MVSNLIPSGNAVGIAVNAVSVLLPYEKRISFVDAANTKITMQWSGGIGTLEHFPDDRPAVTIAPVRKVETTRSYNGRMVTCDEIEIVRVTVSVLPHTKDEQLLNQIVLDQDAAMRNAGGVEIRRYDWTLNMDISQNKMTDSGGAFLGLGQEAKNLYTTFKDGRIVEVPGGYGMDGEFASAHSTTNDGRLASGTYVFEFGQWYNGNLAEKKNIGGALKNAGLAAARVVASVI